MGSNLKGTNLLRLEQIRSFMRWPLFTWKATIKMAKLLPLKVYIFTLKCQWQVFLLLHLLMLYAKWDNNELLPRVFSVIKKDGTELIRFVLF